MAGPTAVQSQARFFASRQAVSSTFNAGAVAIATATSATGVAVAASARRSALLTMPTEIRSPDKSARAVATRRLLRR